MLALANCSTWYLSNTGTPPYRFVHFSSNRCLAASAAAVEIALVSIALYPACCHDDRSVQESEYDEGTASAILATRRRRGLENASARRDGDVRLLLGRDREAAEPAVAGRGLGAPSGTKSGDGAHRLTQVRRTRSDQRRSSSSHASFAASFGGTLVQCTALSGITMKYMMKKVAL